MPRRSPTGDYTFSASEVAEYIVCPEAWYHLRLSNEKNLNNVSRLPIDTASQEGEILHQEWAKDYAEGLSLARMLRLLAALSIAATLIFMLQYDKF